MEENEPDIRPVAIMIDNMASARPQSGLINADIVYEMPAEGGITRYMAIYHHQSSDKIGPVRSARSIISIRQWNTMRYMSTVVEVLKPWVI